MVENSDSAAFLSRVRENLRARLFGSSTQIRAETIEPAVVPEPSAPEMIGRYEVLGRIGSGGMGVIYSAFDAALGRKVAVKLLNPKGGRDEEARSRLMREAQALARLSHPSIVHVYEVGTFEDQVFVAMEFVAGTTLRAWQSRSEHSWRSILTVYKAAAEGLAAGHDAGIVHRDFKPDNVLVRDDEVVRVIDFGLARTETQVTPKHNSRPLANDSDVALTKTGTLMGTPAYMAPEQFKGETADARTDQFAFCIALYEAMYGFRPFVGTTIKQLAQNVLEGNVEPPPRYTDVPERMMRVLLRGLEVDPIERYDDMQALIDDLPANASRTWLYVAAATVAMVVATIAIAALWSWRADLRHEEQLAELRQDYTAQRGAEAEARLRESWVRDRAERYDEFMLRTAEGLVRTDPTGAIAALKGFRGPSGQWLPAARILAASASLGEVQTRQVPLDVGPVVALAVDEHGDTIVAATSNGVQHIAAGTRTASRLLGGPDKASTVAISADAARIVAGGLDGSVHVWTETSATPKLWTRLAAGPVQVAISSDGSTLVAGDSMGQLAVGKLDAPKVERRHSKAITALAISSTAEILVSAGDDGRIWVENRNDEERWDIAHRPGVSATAAHFGADELYVDCVGSDGQVLRIATTERRSELRDEPRFVGLLASAKDGPAEAMYAPGQPLWLRPDSSAPSRELHPGKLSALAMSSDGSTVVAAGSDDVLRQWKVASPANPVQNLVDATVLALAYDTVNDRLALGGMSGLVRLWHDTQRSHEQLGQLLGGVHELDFSPEGKYLAALGGLGGITVWDLDEDEDNERDPLSLLPASFEPPIAWSSDGSRLVAQNCEGPRRCGLVVHSLDADERVLSTILGPRIESFVLSEGSVYALIVRSGQVADVELFDLRGAPSRTPPWPSSTPPAAIVGHAFVDSARAIRLVSKDNERIRLWHWEPERDLLTVLDEFNAEAVFTQPSGRAIIVRGAEGDELWIVQQALRQPLGNLPSVMNRFMLSPDDRVLLAESDDALTIVHVPTGIRRAVEGIDKPYAWRGLSGFAMGRSNAVEFHNDPTPSEADAFTRWLDELTDAQPPAAFP